MSDTNKDVYHFVWSEEDHPFTDRTPVSHSGVKERVAKILQETQLEDEVSDLQFKTSSATKSGSLLGKKSSPRGKTGSRQKDGHPEEISLPTEQELFSIEDPEEDNYDFRLELGISPLGEENNEAKSKIQAKTEHFKTTAGRKPALVPPVVNTQHPLGGTLGVSSVSGSCVYHDDVNQSTSQNQPHNFLPRSLDNHELDEDTLDHVELHSDSHPIIYQHHSKLRTQWRHHKRKICIVLTVVFILIGLGIIIGGIIGIVMYHNN